MKNEAWSGCVTQRRHESFHVNAAAVMEDRLHARIVVLPVVTEVVRPAVLAPAVPEAGEGPRLLADVVLGVAAVGAEREELHHLARVVLVRRILRVVASVQPQQHRRVLRHLEQQLVEGAEAVVAEELVLVQHQPLRADAGVRGRKPVVPDQRHPLDEGPRGSHHPVEPPEVVLAPGVEGCERPALLVVRSMPYEVLSARMGQLVDGAFEPESRRVFAPHRVAGRNRRAKAAARPGRLRTSRATRRHRPRERASAAISAHGIPNRGC